MDSTLILNQILNNIFEAISELNLKKIDTLFSNYPKIFDDYSKLILHHTLEENDIEMFMGVSQYLRLEPKTLKEAIDLSIQNQVAEDIIDLLKQIFEFTQSKLEKELLEKNVYSSTSILDKKSISKI